MTGKGTYGKKKKKLAKTKVLNKLGQKTSTFRTHEVSMEIDFVAITINHHMAMIKV